MMSTACVPRTGMSASRYADADLFFQRGIRELWMLRL